MTHDEPPAGLDPDARAMIDVFRQAGAAPSPARDRVWDRLEHSTVAAAAPRGRAAKTVAVLAVVAGLAWLAWPRPQPRAQIAWSDDDAGVGAAASGTVRERVPTPGPGPTTTPSADAEPAPVAVPETEREPAPAPPPASADDTARPGAADPSPRNDARQELAPVSPEARGPSELELVARAKKALARGDAGAALSATAEHERRFPSGMLLEERALLEIEARCSLGERERVDRLRDRFLAAHADSPLADRVRHSCKENDR